MAKKKATKKKTARKTSTITIETTKTVTKKVPAIDIMYINNDGGGFAKEIKVFPP